MNYRYFFAMLYGGMVALIIALYLFGRTFDKSLATTKAMQQDLNDCRIECITLRDSLEQLRATPRAIQKTHGANSPIINTDGSTSVFYAK